MHMPSEKLVIIVGGGLAGLMTAVTACEKGTSSVILHS